MYQLEGKGDLQPRRNAAAGPLHIQPSVQKDIDSCKIPPCLTGKFLVSGHFRDLKQALKNSFRHSRVYFSIQKHTACLLRVPPHSLPPAPHTRRFWYPAPGTAPLCCPRPLEGTEPRHIAAFGAYRQRIPARTAGAALP